jgi:hypothetical protein
MQRLVEAEREQSVLSQVSMFKKTFFFLPEQNGVKNYPLVFPVEYAQNFFLFLKGMTGALAPFSYLVFDSNVGDCAPLR